MSWHELSDYRPTPDVVHTYTDDLRDPNVAIVIDNGSFQCRAGWSVDPKPRMIFKSLLAKQRGKKDYEAQVGNDISNIEVVRWLLKTQFDKDVVTQYDAQEQVFDHIFSHLGIDTQGCVEHPIVMTETLCNPNYSRQLMSELLFEGYHVPRVAYGVDGLFSYRLNHPGSEGDSGLLVSCGHHTIHVMPILDGRLQPANNRRINVGGAHLSGYLHRLLQLKYPAHFATVTLSRAEGLAHEHSYFASDYTDCLNKWADVDFYEKNVHKIQLPYTPLPGTAAPGEAQKERRQQQIKRLQEINTKRREEKLAAEEEKYQQLLSVRDLLDDGDEDTFTVALGELGFSTAAELQDAISKLGALTQKIKEKGSTETKEDIDVQQSEEPKSKRLCEELAAKSHADVDTWLACVRQKRRELTESRSQRRQRKADSAKRRTQAAQQRMRIISELAADKKKEDNFGQNEDDWQVYKAINKEAGETDSEEEQEKLQELEQILREHDPDFAKEFDASSSQEFPFNIEEYYQLHISTERIRIPELLFQPSMMGLEQAGIAETVEFVLGKYSAADQLRLVGNVFLTGGCAVFPGFKERMETNLLSMRPFQTEFRVSVADDPVLDAWTGAKAWANIDQNLERFSVTKQDYEEKGGEYLRMHSASNDYFPTPHALPTPTKT